MTFEFHRAAKDIVDVVNVVVPINKQIDTVVVNIVAYMPVDVAINVPVELM